MPMKLGSMIMFRSVYTEHIPIHIPFPIPMQMATVPYLAPISVPFHWNRSRSRAVEIHHKLNYEERHRTGNPVSLQNIFIFYQFN